jgi:hypothetical protein
MNKRFAASGRRRDASWPDDLRGYLRKVGLCSTRQRIAVARLLLRDANYAYSLNKWVTLTFDYQFIVNPGYNSDRGPVSIFSGRLHTEF